MLGESGLPVLFSFGAPGTGFRVWRSDWSGTSFVDNYEVPESLFVFFLCVNCLSFVTIQHAVNHCGPREPLRCTEYFCLVGLFSSPLILVHVFYYPPLFDDICDCTVGSYGTLYCPFVKKEICKI